MKKIIKWVLVIVLALSIILGLFIIKNKKEYCYYLAIGDYVSKDQILKGDNVKSFSSYLSNYLISNKLVNESNKDYLKNSMTSKKMLEMIENDIYVPNDEGIVKKIKKSKYITITLGVNDLINNLKYDNMNDKLIYDKDLILNKIDIFKHNYYTIVDNIKDINKDAKIILVGSYPFYNDKEISNLLNEAIKDVAYNYDCLFVDTVSIDDGYLYDDNKLYLNNMGQEKVYNNIVSILK